MKRGAQANLAEIKVSQLAELAKTKNLKVPDDMDMMHETSMKTLQAKSGDKFDEAYMEQMKSSSTNR